MRLISVNQNSGGSDDYPLIHPSPEITGQLVDCSLWLVDCPRSLSIFLSTIDPESHNVVLIYEDGEEVFSSDAGTTFTESFWGGEGDPYVLWSLTNSRGTLSLIFRHDSQVLLSAVTLSDVLLDPRVISFAPRRVKRIGLVDTHNQIMVQDISSILFREGYNASIKIAPSTSDVRRGAVITLDAVAGAGAGRVPCIQEDAHPTLKFLNGVSPTSDTGRVYVETADGYGLETDPSEMSQLYLRNTDTPCCSCERIADVDSYVAELASKFYSLGAKLHTIHTEHSANIEAWNRLELNRGPEINYIDRDIIAVQPFRLTLLAEDCHHVLLRVDATNISDARAHIWCNLNFSSNVSALSDVYTYQSWESREDSWIPEGSSEPVVQMITVPVVKTATDTRSGWSHTTEYPKGVLWSSVEPGSTVSWQVLLLKRNSLDSFRVFTSLCNIGGSLSGSCESLGLDDQVSHECLFGGKFYSNLDVSCQCRCTSEGDVGLPEGLADITSYSDELLSQIRLKLWDLKRERFSSCTQSQE